MNYEEVKKAMQKMALNPDTLPEVVPEFLDKIKEDYDKIDAFGDRAREYEEKIAELKESNSKLCQKLIFSSEPVEERGEEQQLEGQEFIDNFVAKRLSD